MRRLSRRQWRAALALGIVAVLLLTLDVTGGALAGSHSGVQGALGSLYRGTDSVIGPIRRYVQAVPQASSNREKVQQLQAENAQLQGAAADEKLDATQLARLNAIDARARALGKNPLPARITALGPGQGFDWTVTLGVGSAEGVAVDQSVTDGVGLVGRILHVQAHSSTVLLAADTTSGVGVRDGRSGQLGLATGAGTRGLSVSPLDPTGDFKVGDQLFTGPVGATTFVGDLLVGTVNAVHRSADGSITADVTPATSPTSLDLVAVLLPASAGATQAAGR